MKIFRNLLAKQRRKHSTEKTSSNQPASVQLVDSTKVGSTQVNIYTGNTPPPGAIAFHPDGTITRTPSDPKAQLEWAVAKWTQRIAKDPGDSEGYGERALALFKLGRYSEAIPDFDKLLEIYPGFSGYLELRGLCYYHTGQYEQAIDDLRSYKKECRVDHQKPETLKILDELEQKHTSA